MYHIVYLTTNLVNQKFYVGVHSTYNLDDGYLGSGNIIRYSIKKYGKQNFKRAILHYCLEAEHAYELESQIVDVQFVKRKDIYNITLGGNGGAMDEISAKKVSSKLKNRPKSDAHKLALSKAKQNKRLYSITDFVSRFITKANKKHNNLYGYTHSNFNDVFEKTTNYINISCPIHGVFKQHYKIHLDGCGCPLCGTDIKIKKQTKHTTKEFVEKSNEIHNNKYDYSKTIYTKMNDKVIIICPIHGEFEQKAFYHINGRGCIKCNNGGYRPRKSQHLNEII